MITFSCPQCQASMEVPDSLAGRSGLCPNCHQSVQVPIPHDTAEIAAEVIQPAATAADIPVQRPYHPQQDSTADGRKCGRCGEMVPMEVAFCRACGSYVPGNITPKAATTATPSAKVRVTSSTKSRSQVMADDMPSPLLTYLPIVALLLGLSGIFNIFRAGIFFFFLPLGGLLLAIYCIIKLPSSAVMAKRWSSISVAVSLAVLLVIGSLFAFEQITNRKFVGQWVSVNDVNETLRIEADGTDQFLVYINDAKPITGTIMKKSVLA